MKDGLSNDYVTAIVQDLNGFVWLGTANGLNRYDANRIKQFYHEAENSNSLPNSYVTNLLVDKQNRIWIGTAEGLSCYNQSTNQFINFSHNDSANRKLSADYIYNLFFDETEKLWLTSSKGFYTIDKNFNLKKEERSVWISNNHLDTLSLVNKIYKDHSGKIWTYIADALIQLEPKTMQPIKVQHFPYAAISSIYQDKHNQFWISTSSGKLYLFDSELEKFSNTNIQLPENEISDLTEWIDGDNSWLLLAGFSLTLVNTKTLQVKVTPPNIYNKHGYQGTHWAQIMIDKDNRVWMGYERGCNISQLQLQNIDIIPLTTPGQIEYQEPSYKLIGGFYDDSLNYWICKWGFAGIFQYNHQWKLMNYHSSINPFNKKIFNAYSAYTCCKKNADCLYLTGVFGFVKWDLKTNKIITFKNVDNNKYPEMENIIEVEKNKWWLLTISDGIYVFDVSANKFIKHYEAQKKCNDNCLPGFLTGIFKLPAENILLTSTQGVFKYNAATDGFNSIISKTELTTLASPWITAIASDKNGFYWIGTACGVCVYNPSKKTIIDTFPENKSIGYVDKLIIDKADNIWCTTRSAIWCWVNSKKQWVSYSSLDGLPNEVYEGSLENLKDSSVIVAIGEKIVRFPNGYLKQNYISNTQVYITNVNYNNKEIVFFEKKEIKKLIEISPDEKNFSVDFAILNYDQPNSIKYLYKLEPLMKNFAENLNGHLTFYDLPHGKYKLIVKGADKLNKLTLKEDILEIQIKPFWFETILFKIISIFLLFVTTFILIKRRVNHLRQNSEIKQQILETEMAALKAQMNPHFMFNCINSIDAFIQSNDKYNATLYLNKFAKLIRNVLDSSKQNLVTFSKDIETLKLYIQLEELRSENKFTTKLNIDEELMSSDYKVPPLIIQPFVENAIIHGLRNKETNDGILSVNISKTENHIIYSITDNGIGRIASQKINTGKEKSYGMEMSYDRVKLFNKESTASITITDLYENEKATGTNIQVHLNIV